MHAIVVYESIYGNTRALAEAIADGLGGCPVMAVEHMAPGSPGADLLVVGGPTHMHSLSTARSHQAAAATAADGPVPKSEGASTIRDWIAELPPVDGHLAAAFDTRLDKPSWVTGAASTAIAKRLRHSGYELVGAESFLVESMEGPIVAGELDRAREWAAQIAADARRLGLPA